MKLFNRNYIIICIVIIEICAIAYLWQYIQAKRTIAKNALDISATQLHKDDLVFPTDSSVRFFYELKPNQTEKEKPDWLPYTAIHTTNNDGLHERNNYPTTKDVKNCRIMTIGDSFTYGSFVNTSENWTELLENRLNTEKPTPDINTYEVINLGVPGYDIQYALHRFRERGLKYNPDVVIWLLKDDDFDEIYELLAPKISKWSQIITQEERKEYIEKNQNYYPEWTLAIDEINNAHNIDARLHQQNSFFEAYLTDYTNLLVLITFPFTDPRYDNLMKKWVGLRPKTVFTDALTDIYARNEYLPDSHPDKRGHKNIADYIFKYLQKNRLLCDRLL